MSKLITFNDAIVRRRCVTKKKEKHKEKSTIASRPKQTSRSQSHIHICE
jgi:hypothetical protein